MLLLCTSATQLNLGVNKISVRGQRLPAAFAEGAMPKLEDSGSATTRLATRAVAAEAVGKGALPELRHSTSRTTSLRRQRTRARRSRPRGAGWVGSEGAWRGAGRGGLLCGLA